MVIQDRYDGFREFAAGRGPALSRAAFVLTGNHQAAEDLLQEALAKTAVHWRRVEAGGKPEAYVRKVMLNQLRSWLRRRRFAEVPIEGIAERAGGTDVADQVTQRVSLSRALVSLPPRQRAVLFLRFYEDMSEVATAEQLGCSVGTVKRHAHDALGALRRTNAFLLEASNSSEVLP
jgi:RNA polymerase sigma-70 factor (sigma-E family)